MASESGRPSQEKRLLPLLLLLLFVLVIRLPLLRRADGLVHSDSAVVGLQGLHLLRGEWSPFLWGTDYQSSFDSAAAALFFLFLGPNSLALSLSAFSAYALLLVLLDAFLSRRVESGRAWLLLLPLVFAPPPVLGPAFLPPRQWAVLFAAASVLIACGMGGLRGTRRPAAAGLLWAASFFMDRMMIVVLPGVAAAAVGGKVRSKDFWIRASVLAAALFPVSAVLTRFFAGPLWGGRQLQWSPERFASNADLLVSRCLPFAFAAGVPDGGGFPGAGILYASSGALLAGLLGWAGMRAFGPAGDQDLARSARAAAIISLATLAAFLGSIKPMDVHSARYLAPILWFSPLALSALRLKRRQLALWLAPFVLASASHTVHSFRAIERGDEDRLLHYLKAEGVERAAAPYWTAYRLTFLWNERVTVAPLEHALDRYRPYRTAYDSAKTKAVIFPSSEAASPAMASARADLIRRGVPFKEFAESGHSGLIVEPGRASPASHWPAAPLLSYNQPIQKEGR